MPSDQNTDTLTALREDNERLRRLLDAKDAPAELRHRLHSTVALFRSIIRESAQTDRDLSSYVAHIEDRMDAIARAQAAADAHGAVDLHSLIAEELIHYHVHEGRRATLSGPITKFKHRPGQVLALAIHELTVNAVEHGALAIEGQLKVVWRLDQSGSDKLFTIDWKELGSPIRSPSLTRKGFGSEVLNRMLQYELGAESQILFELDGLHVIIRFPMSDKFGSVEDE